jgi:hypothetical protein
MGASIAENFFSLLQFPSGERINAHKLILTLFSPVFEAEFYGSLNQLTTFSLFAVSQW